MFRKPWNLLSGNSAILLDFESIPSYLKLLHRHECNVLHTISVLFRTLFAKSIIFIRLLWWENHYQSLLIFLVNDFTFVILIRWNYILGFFFWFTSVTKKNASQSVRYTCGISYELKRKFSFSPTEWSSKSIVRIDLGINFSNCWLIWQT